MKSDIKKKALVIAVTSTQGNDKMSFKNHNHYITL